MVVLVHAYVHLASCNFSCVCTMNHIDAMLACIARKLRM